MTLWCENCETFTGQDLEACTDCGTDLVPPEQAFVTPCVLCATYEAIPGADVCFECEEEILSCQKDFGYRTACETYPELCAECFVRLASKETAMCAPCYAEVCWDGKLDSFTGGRFDRTEGYSFWEPEPDLPIPDVAEELETIPAMRVAA